jgi:hypothetical protein
VPVARRFSVRVGSLACRATGAFGAPGSSWRAGGDALAVRHRRVGDALAGSGLLVAGGAILFSTLGTTTGGGPGGTAHVSGGASILMGLLIFWRPLFVVNGLLALVALVFAVDGGSKLLASSAARSRPGNGRSGSRVRLIPHGVNGPLRWRDIQVGGGVRPANHTPTTWWNSRSRYPTGSAERTSFSRPLVQ